jgi:hypothetical protein
MKLDPGMHIGMHLVFFGKSGVTGHCIALHRSACKGVPQARQERRLVLQVPRGLIEASTNIVVKAESVQVCAVRPRVPPAAGGLPLLL